MPNRHTLRQSALELVAVALEEFSREVVSAIRSAAGTDNVHTSEAHLPHPEVGDKISGMAHIAAMKAGKIPAHSMEQEGMTEAEWEALR